MLRPGFAPYFDVGEDFCPAIVSAYVGEEWVEIAVAGMGGETLAVRVEVKLGDHRRVMSLGASYRRGYLIRCCVVGEVVHLSWVIERERKGVQRNTDVRFAGMGVLSESLELFEFGRIQKGWAACRQIKMPMSIPLRLGEKAKGRFSCERSPLLTEFSKIWFGPRSQLLTTPELFGTYEPSPPYRVPRHHISL